MKSGYFLLLLFLLFVFGHITLAQPGPLPLTRDAMLSFVKPSDKEYYSFHSNIKPYTLNDLKKIASDTAKKVDFPMESLINRLSTVKKKQSNIHINPVYSLIYGYDLANKEAVYQSSIGFRFRASLSNKFYTEVKFEAINQNAPAYVDSVIKIRQVVPGGNYASATRAGYASNLNYGNLCYEPNRYFNFQLGYGRNFFGDGYRSLLLSDNAYSYPFAKLNLNIWRFKYVSMLANFKDIRPDPSNRSSYINKFSSIHYLSWNALSWLNFSLFEAIVYESRRNFNYQSFEVNYLIPVIFYRPAEYSLGSGDNALLGSSFRISLFKNFHLFGQVILDEFFLKEVKARNGWQDNKQGAQGGFRYTNAFGVKGLSIHSEINIVRPYTYYHKNSIQNYGHFNQALAHPLGANFSEVCGFISYRYKKVLFAAKLVTARIGLDFNNTISYGQDIYKSYLYRPSVYGNSIAQGYQANLIHASFRTLYYITHDNNCRIEFNATYRSLSHTFNSQKALVFTIGILTQLDNRYFDF